MGIEPGRLGPPPIVVIGKRVIEVSEKCMCPNRILESEIIDLQGISMWMNAVSVKHALLRMGDHSFTEGHLSAASQQEFRVIADDSSHKTIDSSLEEFRQSGPRVLMEG